MTSSLPRGTVTLLFTDVEGSTALLDRLGRKHYVPVLEAHRALLREAVARHGGVEVEMQGDSFHFAFPYARDAVAAASAAQRALLEHAWPQNGQVRVRMGLHTGEPEHRGDLYAGMDVHRAARVMSTAHGGQVVLSGRTADLVEGELPEGVAVRELGSHRLRDLGTPVRLHQLVIDGLPDDLAPPRPEGLSPLEATARRRPRVLVAAIVVALALVGAAALALAHAFDGSKEAVTVAPNSLVAVDASDGRVRLSVPVGTTPTVIAPAAGAVWVLNADDGTVTRVDLKGRTTRTIAVGLAPTALLATDAAVWVSEGSTGRLTRIATSDHSVGPVVEQELGRESNAIGAWGQLAGDNADVWVSNKDETVTRIDAATGALRARIRVGDVGPIAVGEGAVWVGGFTHVFRIDPKTEKVVNQIDLTTGVDGISGLAAGAGSVWAAVQATGALWQISAETNRVVRTMDVGAGALAVGVAGEAVWVATSLDGSLVEIDSETGRIRRSIRIGRPVRGLAATRDTVWASVG